MSKWLFGAALALMLGAPAAAAPAVRGEASAAPLAKAAVLRLHIVANSTSRADLAAKLAVRDALVTYLAPRLRTARTAVEAEAILRPLTGQVSRIAQETLSGYGMRYGARAVLGMANIGARSSPAGQLGAGRYPVLVVLLGQARGQNWWCLLFPQLCLSGRASAYGFSEGHAASPRRLSMLTPEVSLLGGGGKVRPGGLIWHFWQLFNGTIGLALAVR